MPESVANPIAASALSNASPFPGLRPYGEEDANWFFGRSAEVNELLKRLRRLHFVAVVGASGSGKSSLVRAGVLPQIRDGYLDAEWQIATFRPGEQPIANLAAALGHGIDSGPDSLLRSGPGGLVRALKRAGVANGARTLILVDQFEELFQFAHRKGEAAQEEIKEFLKLLLTATGSDEIAVYVVVTMRVEWLNECATYTGLAEAINEGIYLVPQMQRRQFGQAILRPMEAADGSLTAALLDRMLNDLDSRSDQLPVLQHALLRLWARGHNEDPFDIRDYEAVGTFFNCLSNHAQDVYDELTSRQKEIAELLFRNITQVNKSRKIRRPRALAEIQQSAHVELAELIPVIEAFSKPGRSFLVTTQGALGPESIVDISHEALIRQWGRLSNWVDSEAEIQARLTRLDEDAAEWDRDREHSGSCLYTGVRLTRAKELAPRVQGKRPAADFLRESERVRFWTMLRRRSLIVGAICVFLVGVGMVMLNRERALQAERKERQAEKEMADSAQAMAQRQANFESSLRKQLSAANGSPTAIAAIVRDLNAQRIYVQYTPGQAAAAQAVQARLQKSNFVVPGVQQVSPEKSPSITQVRYFHPEDKDSAGNIASMLRRWISGAVLPELAQNPKGVVPTGQFEVWLAAPSPSTPNAGNTTPGAVVTGGVMLPDTTSAPTPEPEATLTASASPTSVERGHSVVLSWHSENTTAVFLEGVGFVESSGSRTMTPQQTTTYRFSVKKGDAKPVWAPVTVEVVEPAPPPPAAAPASASTGFETVTNNSAQLQQVIQLYKTAYESESLDEVKKVWPTINAKQQSDLKKTFDQFNAIKLDMQFVGDQFAKDSSTATAYVKETARFTQRGQILSPPPSTVTFTFRKENGQWLIDNVRSK